MKTLVLTAAIALAVPVKAATSLTTEQLIAAMVIDTSIVAANNCPGLHIIDGSIRAYADSVGLTPDQAMGGEWKTAMAIADQGAEEEYKKDPAGWCTKVLEASQSLSIPILAKTAN